MVSRALSGMTDERLDFAPRSFNREYSVDCRDRELLRSLLSKEMCDYLVENRGWTVELCSAGLVVSGKGEWTMDEFRSALEFLAGLVERLPTPLREAAKIGK